MKGKILLVEDSDEICVMLELSLGTGHDITRAKNAKEAMSILSDEEFDLVLLDIELPDGNGYDICTSIRANSPDTAVFFLTSKDELSEKVLGFSAGADDYITKPFEMLEVKARVDAKITRLKQVEETLGKLEWENIRIDMATHQVEINDSGVFKEIDLTSLELKILNYMAQKPSIVIPRDDILDAIWGKDVHVYSRSVDTHVSKLRKKLGNHSEMIESIHGVGYKFNP